MSQAKNDIERYLCRLIGQDLSEKIVLLSGPRQVGKTYLSRQLAVKPTQYLNFDSEADRRMIRERSWLRGQGLLILDELHKMKGWKSWLKGIYDTEGLRPQLLVTGSARLDTFRKGGESLAGRHFHFRLHPFSIAELSGQNNASDEQNLNSLLRLGGFPEPFLNGSETFAARWRRTHVDRILREDILDLQNVRDLKSLEILERLVSERVGSTLSYASLAEDLQISPHTVKAWLEILENLYVVFKVTPYSKNIAKSVKKEPKYFMYDIGRVNAESPGAKLENLVASHLLKRAHFLEDTQGERVDVHYIRDKEKREVDFLTVRNGKPEWLIEVKSSDDQLSPSLRYYTQKIKPKRSLQLVHSLKREKQIDSQFEIRSLSAFLATLEV